MGKAIYNPSGKAGEYGYWAANFYNGCSNDCEYCYCKDYPMGRFWSTTPTLKKSLVNENKALEIFNREMWDDIESLRKHGLFFNFTSDPFLKETIELNMRAINQCNTAGIPVKTLTKQTCFADRLPGNVCPGFTLTGHDELELHAKSNEARIEEMKYLHDKDFKTWASIEPIIDFESSREMIWFAKDSCCLFKIGLKSGNKYPALQLRDFIEDISRIPGDFKIYWKDELLNQAAMGREGLPKSVDRNYKLWEQK